jgi:hypothetical protein
MSTIASVGFSPVHPERALAPRSLFMGVAVGATSLLLADTLANGLVWAKSDKTEVIGQSYRALAVAGLNCIDAKPIADKTGCDYLRYSTHDGITPATHQEGIGNYLTKRATSWAAQDSLTVIGHSAGARTFIEAVREARKHSVVVPHIGRLVLLSSPWDIQDVHNNRAIAMLARNPIRLGPAAKFVGETVSHVIEDGEFSARRAYNAAKLTLQGLRTTQSNKLWYEQLGMLVDAKPLQNGELHGVIDHDTHIVYVGDSANDRVVNVPSAVKSIRSALVEPYNAQFQYIESPIGHASLKNIDPGLWTSAIATETTSGYTNR